MTSALLNIVSSAPVLGFLAQTEPQTPSGGGGIAGIISLAIMVAVIAGVWKTFVKAGQPGWAAIIPIYNLIVMLQIAGKPVWWVVLFLIPVVNIVVGIIVMIAFAKSFGKGTGYGIGCALLGFIFIPLLGFGDAKYIGPQP